MTTDAASYNECIKNCDLDNVSTDKLYGEVFDRGSPTKSSELQISVNPKAELIEDNIIEASLDAKLEAFLRAKAKRPAWTIEAKVVAIYTLEENCSFTDEQLELFADRQGVLTLMPYLRGAVSSLSTDMGVGPITLPLYKLFPTITDRLTAAPIK